MSQKEDKQFIEELVGEPQTDQQIFEAMSNLIGLFDLLFQVDERNQQKNNGQH